MKNIKNNITELIGNTPLIALHNRNQHYQLKAELLVKFEAVKLSASEPAEPLPEPEHI